MMRNVEFQEINILRISITDYRIRAPLLLSNGMCVTLRQAQLVLYT